MALGAATDVIDCQAREMHNTQGMLESRVAGSGPDSRNEPELLDAFEAHKRRGADQGDVRAAQGNPVVEGVAHGGFDRKTGGRGCP